MLYDASSLSLSMTLINASVLIYVLWSAVEHSFLLVWGSVLVCVVVGRLIVAWVYARAQPGYDQIEWWVYLFNGGVVLVGLTWASASIFLFPHNSIEHQVFLAFVLGGMSAGAVTTLSFLRFPILIYLSCLLIPVIVQFVTVGSEMSLVMALMIILFFMGTATSAMRIYHDTALNIGLRFEAAQSSRALGESEERYRMMFEAAPLGVMHFDRDGVILSYNPVFMRFLGEQRAQLVGMDMLTKLKDVQIKEAVVKALKGDVGVYTGDMKAFGGVRPLPIRGYFRGIVASSGEVTGGVAMIEDRTEDLRVERLKNEFVSTVSHELRTPLTAIKGALDLFDAPAVQEQPETRQKLLDNAARNTERLLGLINDILDIDKIEQGKLDFKFENLELMQFVEQALEANQHYAKQYDVSFAVFKRVDELWVKADSLRLMQVMSNLLSNAAKFSPSGSRIYVSVEQDVYTKTACICVEDHGMGITEEFQRRIFERFSQYDGSDIRKAGGTGLGLNIAKAIVLHHHGSLTFDSEVGKGSRFYIRLPLLNG